MHKMLDTLYRRRRFGVKLGLEMENAVLAALGNPQKLLAVIHVAGTNGKGSVCAFIEAALLACGYRTGLYTSPHLVRFNDRFRINGVPIDDDDLYESLLTVEHAAIEAQKAEGQEPTFFECATAIAFHRFRSAPVQIAIMETGMGGRLDATNVVDPLVSIITRVDFDHTAYLGDTLEKIAVEKAGIIKPGRPVVCGAMPEEARGVVRRTARERGCLFADVQECANVTLAGEGFSGQKLRVETTDRAYGTVRIPLLGRHQVENLATAVTAIDVLRSSAQLPFDEAAVSAGFSRVNWPGRCEVVKQAPPVILDGAHNPGGAVVFAETLARMLDGKPVALVVGMCGDKDVAGILHPFRSIAKSVWAVRISNERAVAPERILQEARSMGWELHEAALPDAMREAETWAVANNGAVCAAGSLFLVGEVRELLKVE
jgi:dihydrofolate synthase / folylpolyglutamate synthase